MNHLLPATRKAIKMSGGVKQIAPMLGIKNPIQLINQTCETNRQHKLGAKDLQKIIRFCRPHSIEIVQILAADVDSVVVELPQAEHSTEDFPQLVLQAAKAYGEVADALLKSVDPDSEGGEDVTMGEYYRIEKKIYKTHRVFQEILKLARKLSGSQPNRPKLD